MCTICSKCHNMKNVQKIRAWNGATQCSKIRKKMFFHLFCTFSECLLICFFLVFSVSSIFSSCFSFSLSLWKLDFKQPLNYASYKILKLLCDCFVNINWYVLLNFYFFPSSILSLFLIPSSFFISFILSFLLLPVIYFRFPIFVGFFLFSFLFSFCLSSEVWWGQIDLDYDAMLHFFSSFHFLFFFSKIRKKKNDRKETKKGQKN